MTTPIATPANPRKVVGVVLVHPDTPGLGGVFGGGSEPLVYVLHQKANELFPADVKAFALTILSETNIAAEGRVIRTAVVFRATEFAG